MHIPKLLVSVKNETEVGPALEGGADIIDIKNPALGSLGMAAASTMNRIINAVKTWEQRIGKSLSEPVITSAALGETSDWLEDNSPPVLPNHLSLVKMGTAGMGNVSNWRQRWEDVRNHIAMVNDNALRWVAVSYVDWKRAKSPSPDEIVDAAIETDCAGVLFDTYQKDTHHLLDWLTVDELSRLITKIHASDLFVACAGKVHAGILQELMTCKPDVIAIRSAGCHQGIREAAIDANAVRNFQCSMKSVFSNHPESCSQRSAR